MTNQIFATKFAMGQSWTTSGRRIPVSKLRVDTNVVLGHKSTQKDGYVAVQIGYGLKKMKNMTKPLRSIVEKSGFSFGVRQIRELRVEHNTVGDELAVGTTLSTENIIKIGDVVNVQGTTKGRGFAGVMKRHGFHGGPRTHGQSDRARAPGSIGQRTTPGRVYKGKRMAGRYGNETLTVKNLQVVHISPDQKEIWVNGPVPGHMNATIRLTVVKHEQFEGLVGQQTTSPAEA